MASWKTVLMFLVFGIGLMGSRVRRTQLSESVTLIRVRRSLVGRDWNELVRPLWKSWNAHILN